MEFLPAKVAEASMTTMMKRPDLKTLVKEAMAGTLSKADINAEVARMSMPDGAVEKTASFTPSADEGGHLATEQIHKLASAVGYIAFQLEKGAEVGEGPGALEVSQATSSEKNIDAHEGGKATGANQPPTNPSTQAEEVQTGKANTGLQTNDSMSHSEQPTEPIANQDASLENDKSKAAAARVSALVKAAGTKEPVSVLAAIRKLAADSENPAQISGGTHDAAESPAGVSASGEGKPPVPSDVSKQERLISSNEAATDYTKRDAKADPKSDVNQVLHEPAQTSATDKVLDKVLDHTDEAGAKISSVRDGAIKVAAARALLSKLVKEAAEKDPKKLPKKEKASQGMGGAAPATPQDASGFNASSI
jgi:hypothetical protein